MPLCPCAKANSSRSWDPLAAGLQGAIFSIHPRSIILSYNREIPNTRRIRGRPEGSGMRLRVNASPDGMHAVGEEVWMAIDPSQIASVPEPEGIA